MQPATRQRALRIAASCAGVLVLVVLLGFFAAPPIVRPMLERNASAALGRAVSIESLALNPLTLSAHLRGIAVAGPEGKPALSIEALDASLGAATFVRFAPVVDELRIVAPRVLVTRIAANRYDWSDVVERLLSGPSHGTPRFALAGLRIERGEIDFDDRPERQRHAVRDLELTIPFASSLAAFAGREVEPSFSARINGSPVALKGRTLAFDASLRTAISVTVDGLELSQYAAYVPVPLDIDIREGTLQGRIDVGFARERGQASTLAIGGDLVLSRLDVRDGAGRALAAAARIGLAGLKVDLLGRSGALARLDAEGIDVHLARDAKGGLNIASLAAKRGDAPQSPQSPFAFDIAELAVSGSQLTFVDEAVATPFKIVAEELEATAKGLTTRAGGKADWAASFRTRAGDAATAAGTLALSPLEAEGRVELTGIGLKNYAPYYASALDAEVGDGSLSASARFSYRAGGAGSADEVRLGELAARVAGLRMTKAGADVARLGTLELSNGEVDLARRTVTLGAMALRDGRIEAKRDSAGRLNLAQLTKGAGSPGGAPWNVTLGKASVEQLEVVFEDASAPKPVRMALGPVSGSVEGLSTLSGTRGRIDLRVASGTSGSLGVAGPLQLEPFAAELKVSAQQVELAPLAPYLTGVVNAALQSAAANASGRLSIAGSNVSYNGDLGITGFSATSPNGEELLGWKSLTLQTVDVKMAPFALDIGELTLADFYSRLIILPDGHFNLQDVMVSKNEGPAAPRQEPLAIKVGRVLLKGGTIDFSDRFIKPSYSAHLTDVSGAVGGLSADPKSRAQLALKAELEGAPVDISGSLNPLAGDLALDIRASVRGYDLNLLSTYAAKYVGYGIERGKLSLDVRYRIENRKLDAQNQITLNQLTFGAPVDSPEAIKAPVLLAMKLLQNSRGEINVELPVSGSLDDPQFSIAGIVLRVIGNLIVRTITSPFAAIGSLFGGSGGEELAWVEFEPGASAIGEAARSKLDTLARALADRPALTLEIAGRADPQGDGEALKRAKLERKAGNTVVSEDDLRTLASRRAFEVREWLSRAGVAEDRLYLANPREDAERREKARPSRVDLYLH